MAGVEAVKVTAADLGRHEGEAHEGPLAFDLGNLTAWDFSAPDPAAFAAGADAACHALAQSIFQSLADRLFALPSEAAPVGRVAALPVPTTALPREKPIPKPKLPTKWEVFAQKKGIEKRKRSKLEWDEASGEWKRRFGYRRANDEAAVPVIEAGPNDLPGEDPFTKQRQEKKKRIKKQEKQQLANLKAAAKTGGAGALPATLRLAAALPEHGKGRPAKRKDLHSELKNATQQAAVATASMGKFDKLAKGEKAEDRQQRGKNRKFLSVADKNGTERQQISKLVDRLLSERADDVDLGKTIGRHEQAALAAPTHRLKNKGANKKGRLTGGSKGDTRGGPGGRGGDKKGR